MNDTRDPPALGNAAAQSAGASRRGLLECMVWAGAGVLWTMNGGVPAFKIKFEGPVAVCLIAAAEFEIPLCWNKVVTAATWAPK